jgi:mono/diheme cytochrome c family protein
MSGLFMRWLFAAMSLLLPWTSQGADAPGLIVTFKSGDGRITDPTVLPNFAIYVQAGKPPTPFIPEGNFVAAWEGNIVADLRSEYMFDADLNGTLKFEINGSPVLEGSGARIPLSKLIQLNKGPNKLRATFTSPVQGDAFLRVGWTEKGTNTSPIPPTVLTHVSTPALEASAQLRRGRELFLEHRCIKCHIDSRATGATPELTMDAPAFDGIGARRNYEWMTKWILDPKAERASALMPQVFRGPKAKENAEATAAYLASLKSGAEIKLPEYKDVLREGGSPAEPLFERLHCNACHTAPGAETDTNKISLSHVAAKFPPEKLIEFLRQPNAHFTWIRMPDFRVSMKEAKELAEFLTKGAERPVAAKPDDALIEKGKTLVQNSGCLNCHSAKLENKFAVPQLTELATNKWDRGCLAEMPPEKSPQFKFTAAERADLQAFGRLGRESLFRNASAEFAERQTRLSNCNGCHGQVQGFPALEILGAKLKPEWSGQFIAGEIGYKPRPETHPRGEPWVEARMPGFKGRARLIAEGLAALHGFGPKTPSEPPIDNELAKLGQKLVGKDGGFSCVSCHGVAGLAATDVFDSEGINLAYSYDRLLPDYYYRWMRNPLAIDPQTKMPVYFQDGKSPLTEILDGDAEKQMTAIWHYLRLGQKMPPPNTGEAP